MTKICPNCEAINYNGDDYCKICGYDFRLEPSSDGDNNYIG